MTQEKLNKMVADMHESLTNPDKIDENKRKEEIKQQFKNKQDDVGLI